MMISNINKKTIDYLQIHEISQWSIAILIGIPIAVFLAWFNKSGADYKEGFETKKKKK